MPSPVLKLFVVPDNTDSKSSHQQGYGTPYLISLGLSKSLTSLVWLAGPISGLIIQPLIGSISDTSSSAWRRRKFIIISSILVIISVLICAYAQPLARLFVDLSVIGGGSGDWDPKKENRIEVLAIWLAVFSFYVLDFALNALQASLRNLILDMCPSRQQIVANAWHGRMTHAGSILGFLVGYQNLGDWEGLEWIGGGQFRKLSVLVTILLIVTVVIVVVTQKEKKGKKRDGRKSFTEVFERIWESLNGLPVSVQKVCVVQFFAFMGWFPFLFYSTTYVAEIIITSAKENGEIPPTAEYATRIGSLALLLWSVVAMIAGVVLPSFCNLGQREWVVQIIHFRHTDGPIRKNGRKFLRKLVRTLTPRNFWTAGCLMFSLLMAVATFWVRDEKGALTLIAAVGVPWAVACWVSQIVGTRVRSFDEELMMIRSHSLW
jgi:solute carrier family 45, member 1/2/4